jgi:CDP-diacylglycerol--serine O-phosphatidyltransferase
MKSLVPNFFTSSNLGFGVLSIILTAKGDLFYGALWHPRVSRGRCPGWSFGPGTWRQWRIWQRIGFTGRCRFHLVLLRHFSFIRQPFKNWVGSVLWPPSSTLFAVVCAWRGSNLNTTVVHGYFMGVPIPTGGCLFATFVLSGVHIPAGLAAVLVVIMGYLLVSKVP